MRQREITTHRDCGPVNAAIRVWVPSGCHCAPDLARIYLVDSEEPDPVSGVPLDAPRGSLRMHPERGLTPEVLLAVVLDCLSCGSRPAPRERDEAAWHIVQALDCLRRHGQRQGREAQAGGAAARYLVQTAEPGEARQGEES